MSRNRHRLTMLAVNTLVSNRRGRMIQGNLRTNSQNSLTVQPYKLRERQGHTDTLHSGSVDVSLRRLG